MTTPLLDEVTRRTTLTVDDREIEVTLVPGDAASATPEAIRFHLVGMKSGDKTIPLPMLLRLAGYAVKLPKLAKGDRQLTPSEEIKRLFEQPEILALEARIKSERATSPAGLPIVVEVEDNGDDLA